MSVSRLPQIPIVYEDESLLVVNKPPGVVVNNAESVREPTLQDWAAARLGLEPSRGEEFRSRAGLVHRLDKETSGLILIAKNAQAYLALKQQFQERTIKKSYLALVHGRLPAAEGSIDLPISRLPRSRQKFGILPGGRAAKTDYRLVKVFRDQNTKADFSLVDLQPRSGRTHQLRVHLKYLGHPLVSDPLYLGTRQRQKDHRLSKRLFLHAYKLEFQHPQSGKSQEVSIPLADDLAGTLSRWQNAAT